MTTAEILGRIDPCLFFHKWGNWHNKREFIISRIIQGEERQVGGQLVQERICLDCEKVIHRVAEWRLNIKGDVR